jgi:hypothetical protein
MKRLDLNAYGVEEMSNVAMRKTEGGFWQFFAAAVVAGAIYDLVCHTGDTIRSYKKGADAANAAWD